MPDGEVRDFLIANESEVKDMMLTEYDEKATPDYIGKERFEDGVERENKNRRTWTRKKEIRRKLALYKAFGKDKVDSVLGIS